MSVTEIALLHLSPNVSIKDSDLRSRLAYAKKVMQDYTGRSFYYLQQIEDSSNIYIIGEWGSLDQHMKNFIPSEANQALLQALKDDLNVKWLMHIDASHDSLPLPKSDAEKTKALRGELAIGIVRHFVKSAEMSRFQQTFEENKQYLQGFLSEGTLGGGWRIDNEGGKEEWVLLCPWTSVKQHEDFASTAGFEKYGQIRAHIDGAEIKHAKLLDI
jgi:quinol monooxygenase YgiN